MFAVERQNIICQKIEDKGSVSISELTDLFEVSVETIRRDLLELERQGKLRRIHGGAMSSGGIKREGNRESRISEFAKEKAEVAEIGCSLIEEDDLIAIDCGSTGIKFSEALAKNFKKLTVITNSLDNFEILRQNPGIKIILIGGEYDSKERVFFSHPTEEMIRSYHVSKSFIFPYAVSLHYGISGYGGYMADIQRAYMEIADKIIIMADSDKIEKNAFERLCDTEKAFTYVSDSKVPEIIKSEYAENGIELLTEKKG